MKLKNCKPIIIYALLVAMRQTGHSQGFVNLDFEDATVTPTPVNEFGGSVDPAIAFPGWTIGGSDTYVLYNDQTLGSPAVSLMGPNFPNATGYTPLQGSYSALIYYDSAAGVILFNVRIVIAILFITLLALIQNGQAQGFANLNFESAQVIPIVGSPLYPNAIATTDALPDWAVYFGSIQQSQITDTPALGSTWVFLIATNGALSGNFSVGLQGGSTYPSASISQTGLVPAGTESLQFEAQSSLAAIPGSLVVALGGQNILFSALSTGSNYTLYGGDIPLAFAGQTEQLTFSALESIYGANNWDIDNIQFSPSSVPEPSGFALGALGALLFGFRRWRNSSQ